MTRRHFLRRSGLTLGTVAVAGAGALAYRAYDRGVFEAGRGPAYEPWTTWQQGIGITPLVRAAILAPSPHNAQGWRFRLGDGSLDLYADRTRSTGALDPFLREMRIGLGAALENIVLTARSRGSTPHVLLMPAGPRSDHVAHLAVLPGGGQGSELAAQIPHRHTNRFPYVVGRDVPSTSLTALAQLVDASVPDTRVVWLTTHEERNRIGELVIAATEAIIDDPDQRDSDSRWFRQSWDEIQDRRDGITIDAAGLSDLTAAAAKLLPAQSPRATGEAWLESTRDRHTRTAAAYGIVMVRDAYDPVQQLQGGRLLQRLHLAATGQGIALHHMNQITERADRERQLGLPSTFGAALEDVVPADWQALATFRVGYATHQARPSPRRPIADVVVP